MISHPFLFLSSFSFRYRFFSTFVQGLFVTSWSQANKLSLNVAKTHSLVIGCRKRLEHTSDDKEAKPSFVMGEENVSIVESIKYLGVIADKYLSWDEQISALTKKVSR